MKNEAWEKIATWVDLVPLFGLSFGPLFGLNLWLNSWNPILVLSLTLLSLGYE